MAFVASVIAAIDIKALPNATPKAFTPEIKPENEEPKFPIMAPASKALSCATSKVSTTSYLKSDKDAYAVSTPLNEKSISKCGLLSGNKSTTSSITC